MNNDDDDDFVIYDRVNRNNDSGIQHLSFFSCKQGYLSASFVRRFGLKHHDKVSFAKRNDLLYFCLVTPMCSLNALLLTADDSRHAYTFSGLGMIKKFGIKIPCKYYPTGGSIFKNDIEWFELSPKLEDYDDTEA